MKNNLRYIALSLILLAGSGGRLGAQDSPIGADAGRDLAVGLSSLRPEENVKWSGTLKINGRKDSASEIPISCETVLTETNWSVIYLTGATKTLPAEKLTVVFSTNGPNQYFYARAAAPGEPVGAATQLTGAQANVPLGGSDFWLSDLGFEFYHWPQQNRLKGERMRGQPCYVLESVNPRPQAGGYGRVLTWVDEKSNQPLQAKAFAADGKTGLKNFELGSVEKVNGRYQVKDLKMYNLKTDSRTYLNFDLDGK